MIHSTLIWSLFVSRFAAQVRDYWKEYSPRKLFGCATGDGTRAIISTPTGMDLWLIMIGGMTYRMTEGGRTVYQRQYSRVAVWRKQNTNIHQT